MCWWNGFWLYVCQVNDKQPRSRKQMKAHEINKLAEISGLKFDTIKNELDETVFLFCRKNNFVWYAFEILGTSDQNNFELTDLHFISAYSQNNGKTSRAFQTWRSAHNLLEKLQKNA